MPQPPNGVIRFGVFELEPQAGILRKGNTRIRLQDQPFQVLLTLLERPGEVITREELQEKVWPGEEFGDFDHRLNIAVNKIREALHDSAEIPRFVETIPRRGYRFIGPVEKPKVTEPTPPPSTPPPPEPPPKKRPPWIWMTAVSAMLLVVAGLAIWLALDRERLPPPRVVPLTTLTGTESRPAFSPDGKQLAFTWNGERRDNFDIYVKMIGEESVLRLTSDPSADSFPAWSPDGRQIAFASARDGGGIYMVSPLGGTARKIADLPTDSRLIWTTDGKYLVVAKRYLEQRPGPDDGALFLVPVDGSARPHQILAPPKGTRYRDPAIAPDGHALAFVSSTGVAAGPTYTIQIGTLEEGLIVGGTVQQIAEQFTFCTGLTWTSDSHSLIYGGGALDNSAALWRVSARVNARAERLELAGTGADSPAIDFKGSRLAFARTLRHPDIWQTEVGGKPSPLLTSSLRDINPHYSPDGRRIAFESARGGDQSAIWVSNADGTGPRRITWLDSPQSGTPRWSPDGRRIAFDVNRKNGGWDVWVIDENGTNPRRLTHGPADSTIPSWSSDGSSIYFASNRSGRFEVWRIPAQGGEAMQITRKGGFTAFESPDGTALYYTLSQSGTEGLYSKRLPDGEERQLLTDRVILRALAVFPDGVYYMRSRDGRIEICFHGFATGRSNALQEIEGPLHMGLSVSPHRKRFLFSKVIDDGADLMLIENFR